jgi:hypothetical protein
MINQIVAANRFGSPNKILLQLWSSQETLIFFITELIMVGSLMMIVLLFTRSFFRISKRKGL